MLSTTYAVRRVVGDQRSDGRESRALPDISHRRMPSYQNQRLRKCMHHTLGDGVFGNFITFPLKRPAVTLRLIPITA